MGDQPWLDSVREQLSRHGLPPSYVQRFTEELGDHLDDLSEEGLEADASSRLGEPKQVANAAVAAYRRRSFLGRHPVAAFLVFAISPVIPQYVLACASVTVYMIASGLYTFDWYEQHWTFSLILVVCSTTIAALYSELALWLGIRKKWALVSCAVLGAIAMLLGSGTHSYTVMLLVQFAAPFAVGWWFTKRNSDHGYPTTTFLVFAVSPVASHLLLFSIVALAVVATAQLSFSSPGGPANPHVALAVLVASLSVLIILLPTLMTSFLYCKLVMWFGVGRKWMLVSCGVLATYTAMLSFRQAAEGHDPVSAAFVTCLIVGHALTPLATAWWFMRRKRDQDQLELAS